MCAHLSPFINLRSLLPINMIEEINQMRFFFFFIAKIKCVKSMRIIISLGKKFFFLKKQIMMKRNHVDQAK